MQNHSTTMACYFLRLSTMRIFPDAAVQAKKLSRKPYSAKFPSKGKEYYIFSMTGNPPRGQFVYPPPKDKLWTHVTHPNHMDRLNLAFTRGVAPRNYLQTRDLNLRERGDLNVREISTIMRNKNIIV